MGSNHPEIQAAVARVRWQRARGVPDPKPKRPGPRVIHQLSVAKEEKLAHATMQAFVVMMSAVRLADLAPQLPNPLHGKIFAAAQEAVELILTGLHDAG